MVVMRTSRPHFMQGVLVGRSGRVFGEGPLAELMAPCVSWRWVRGWNLCALLPYVQNTLCNFYFYVTFIPFRNQIGDIAHATIHP